jgi:hypothetical protein
MEDSPYIKMTMESGSVYTYEHGIVVVDHYEGSRFAIRAWDFFAFEPEELENWNDLSKFVSEVERKKPDVGRRVFVSGKDEWRISTKIKEIEEIQ